LDLKDTDRIAAQVIDLATVKNTAEMKKALLPIRRGVLLHHISTTLFQD
jgi:hypothetical protein